MEASTVTLDDLRRNRISHDSRLKYSSGINQIKKWCGVVNKENLLMACDESNDKQTLNLEVFEYQDFLDFLLWCVHNKPTISAGTLSGYCSSIKSLYKDRKHPLPDAYGDDMKEVLSGIKRFLRYCTKI